MIEHAVVIAGSGPTGLMLAGELALAEIDVVIVERRPNQNLAGQRAGGLLPRTMEVLDQRGIAERFVSEGKKHEATMFAGTTFIKDLPTRHNYVLELKQNHIERILAGWVRELSVPILYSREVTGFTQDESGVDIALSDGSSMRAQYLIGCDGGRSIIRKTAGIEFPGWDPTTSNIIAEVEMTEEPKEWGIRRDARGIHALRKMEDGKTIGVVVTEANVGATTEPTLHDLSTALIAAYGTDFGAHNPTWISRFTDMARQAATYRNRRIFLAGDSAHIHPPDGGQGIQTGMQDAVNLGWKLAQVVKGISPDSLLDTYHAERHPVAARVLRTNMAQVMLRRPDERTQALRETIGELLAMEEPSRKFGAQMFGLDIHYNLGEGHPLLGRRMPDLDLVTLNGPLRMFTLLHEARPVLLNFHESSGAQWADRVQIIDAKYDGRWELPAIGAVTAPTAVLIRPDGYVAWVGDSSAQNVIPANAGIQSLSSTTLGSRLRGNDGTSVGLADVLTKWFGEVVG